MSKKISFIQKISIGVLLTVTAMLTFLLTLGVGFIIGSMITAGLIAILGTAMSPLGLGIISAAVAIVLLLPFMIVCQDSMERLYDTMERKMKDSSKPDSPNKRDKSIKPSKEKTPDSSAPNNNPLIIPQPSHTVPQNTQPAEATPPVLPKNKI